MSSGQSKRQQARNERMLQELIKGIPGNDVCADCGARNPGWASWSLGIFLCMRCAAIHRKLGTHISKVKSLSMDSWSNEQVEQMRRMGNVASNRIFSPTNARPTIPFDADEVDSVMERWIRQKYVKKGSPSEESRPSATRNRRMSDGSDELPPPPPPKLSSKFGFRSASSIFPMSSKSKREAAARANLEQMRVEAHANDVPKSSKPSRTLGQDVGRNVGMEEKLLQLRDMGFREPEKNEAVLRSVKGNLEKAIERLVKLGNNSRPSSPVRSPVSPPSPINVAGLSIPKARDRQSPKSPSNPWEVKSPVSPQVSQPTGTPQVPQSANPYQQRNGSNPFGLQPSQSQYGLNQQYQFDQAFQDLAINPSQPLFPHHTGGTPKRAVFQPGASPALPSIPQGQYQAAVYDESPLSHQQQQQQQFQPQRSQQQYQQYQPQQSQQAQSPAFSPTQSFNPFLHMQSQQLPQNQVFSPNGNLPPNPFFQQQQRAQTFPLQSQQQHSYYDQSNQPSQQAFFDPSQQLQTQNLQQYSPIPQTQQSNPWATQNVMYQVSPQQQQQQPPNPYMNQQAQQFNPRAASNQQSPQSQQSPYFQQQQYVQTSSYQPQMLPQRTGQVDKHSIMALYNSPYSPSGPVQQPQSPMDNVQNTAQAQENTAFGAHMFNGDTASTSQQAQTPTNPGVTHNAESKNPFLHNQGEANLGNDQAGYTNRDSVADVGNWYEQNGRHSPDAFASLSARSMR